eukprot:SAG31_NODE_12719_length_921_cov_4.392944_1_plen_90_part_00
MPSGMAVLKLWPGASGPAVCSCVHICIGFRVRTAVRTLGRRTRTGTCIVTILAFVVRTKSCKNLKSYSSRTIKFQKRLPGVAKNYRFCC